MREHLRDQHQIDLDAATETKTTKQTKEAVQTLLKKGESVADHFPTVEKVNLEIATWELVLWLAESFRPLSTVEDTAFAPFIKSISPDFKVPSRDTVRSRVLLLANELKSQVISRLGRVL